MVMVATSQPSSWLERLSGEVVLGAKAWLERMPQEVPGAKMPAPETQAAIVKAREEAIRTITASQPQARLSGKSWRSMSGGPYPVFYEELIVSVPVEVTEEGNYRISVIFTSPKNEKRGKFRSEQLLTAGRHTLDVPLTFSKLWGFFAAAEGEASQLTVKLEKQMSQKALQAGIKERAPQTRSYMDWFEEATVFANQGPVPGENTAHWREAGEQNFELPGIINIASNSHPPVGYK